MFILFNFDNIILCNILQMFYTDFTKELCEKRASIKKHSTQLKKERI